MIQSIEDAKRDAGNRAIADKILKRLHSLEKTVENIKGRWAWELLQNAKDSIAEEEEKTVSVQIQLDEDFVEFRHNGTPFTTQDITSLISQISSKEIEENQKSRKTGRFGTGFLTTHLLSKVIRVKGIIDSSEGLHEFSFSLDRRGKTTSQLIPKIEDSWNEYQHSIKKIDHLGNEEFTTFFSYHIETEKQKKVARVGIEEFENLIPFVLAFNSNISKVELINNVENRFTLFEIKESFEDDHISKIAKTENNNETFLFVLSDSRDDVSIATEVSETQNGFSIKGVRDYPKIFCDFPLIGTENFHLPIIVNSFFFNPQDERNGIWLKDDDDDDAEVQENRRILIKAFELYKELIAQISEKKYFDLYNFVETKLPQADSRFFDVQWYKENIQQPTREFVEEIQIVELEGESNERKAIKELWFPSNDFSNDLKETIWQFIVDVNSSATCKKDHLNNWCSLAWDGWKLVDYLVLARSVSNKKNLDILSQILQKDENGTLIWLSSLGKFLLEEETNLLLLDKVPILPNRNGIFKKKSELFIDDIQDDELIYILELLGEDWKEMLLHEEIEFVSENMSTKGKKDIAIKITESLNKEIKNELYGNEKLVKAISILYSVHKNLSTLTI
jgi:hypothetical protein